MGQFRTNIQHIYLQITEQTGTVKELLINTRLLLVAFGKLDQQKLAYMHKAYQIIKLIYQSQYKYRGFINSHIIIYRFIWLFVIDIFSVYYLRDTTKYCIMQTNPKIEWLSTENICLLTPFQLGDKYYFLQKVMMYFRQQINLQFYYINTIMKKVCKRFSTDNQREQIYPTVRTTNIKEENSLNLSIFSQQKANQINIPAIVATQPSSSEYFKNNRTNIRQLNNFLKHQGIVIKQKELIITNLPMRNRQEWDIKQMRQKMLKMLNPQSPIKKDLQITELPFPKINKIQLPEMEGSFVKSPTLKTRKNTVSVHSNQSRLRIKKSVNKYPSLNNKIFQQAINKSRLGHQKQPLIIASSKKLSQLGLSPNNSNKKIQDSQKIANFQRFKNYSRLSKLSLRLATEFLPKNNSKGQHHISYSP